MHRTCLVGAWCKLCCIRAQDVSKAVGCELTQVNVQLIMNIPFTALYFATYESSKKILGRTDEDEGLLVQVSTTPPHGLCSAGITLPSCWDLCSGCWPCC